MFVKFRFSDRQIKRYHQAALRDFKIARDSGIPEVIFKFSYDALLKAAIAVSAKNGLRAKARQGHHVALLGKLSEILKDDDIGLIGNEMRGKRDLDLYGGGTLITKKEARDYKKWLETVFVKVDRYLRPKHRLF